MRSLWLVLAAACTDPTATTPGDVDPPPADKLVRSGSRIRAVVGVTPDGASELLGWHDADLDTGCTFRLMGDKQVRCVPDGQVAECYADAACTQPVVLALNCDGTTPRFLVSLTRGSTCTAPLAELHEVQTQARSGTVYLLSEGNGCRQFATGQAHHPTTPVDRKKLAVRATVVVE